MVIAFVAGDNPAKAIKIGIERHMGSGRIDDVRVTPMRVRIPHFNQRAPGRASVLIDDSAGDYDRLPKSLRPSWVAICVRSASASRMKGYGGMGVYELTCLRRNHIERFARSARFCSHYLLKTTGAVRPASHSFRFVTHYSHQSSKKGVSMFSAHENVDFIFDEDLFFSIAFFTPGDRTPHIRDPESHSGRDLPR